MKFAVIGAGAVGGFYGAMLSKAGHEVAFVARGAHRDAMLANGLRILSAPDSVGEFVVKCPVESDPAKIGPVDIIILAIKTYSNAETCPMLKPLFGSNTQSYGEVSFEEPDGNAADFLEDIFGTQCTTWSNELTMRDCYDSPVGGFVFSFK